MEARMIWYLFFLCVCVNIVVIQYFSKEFDTDWILTHLRAKCLQRRNPVGASVLALKFTFLIIIGISGSSC